MDWREQALKEIESIKQHFITKYGWGVSRVDESARTLLYVRFINKTQTQPIEKVLRLAYEEGFPNQRPREGFVNPTDLSQEGLEFWMDDGQQAFKSTHNPPVICLEGTWGFHHILHKERDPHKANINKLLLEVQKCFEGKR